MLHSSNFLFITPIWKQEKHLTSAVTRCLFSSPDSESRGRRALGNTYCGQVLLCHALALPTLLDYFAHLQGNSVMVQLFCLSVELGCVLCDEVLFVLACCPYHSKQEQKKHKSKQNKAQSCTKRYQSSFSKHSAAQNPRELSRIHANVSSDLNSILPAEGQGMCYLNPVKCWHLNTVIQGPPFSLLHIWASLHTCEFLLLLGHLILNFIPRVHIFATA